MAAVMSKSRKSETSATQDSKRTCSMPQDRSLLDEEDVWEVERIVGAQRFDGKKLYRVRWKNFTAESDTWEPYENLLTCKHLVKEYLMRKRHQTELLCLANDSSIHPAKVAPLESKASLVGKDGRTYKTVMESNQVSIEITARIKFNGEEDCTALQAAFTNATNVIQAKLLKDEAVRQRDSNNSKQKQNYDNFGPAMQKLKDPVPAKKSKLSSKINLIEKMRLKPITKPVRKELKSQNKPSEKSESRPPEKFEKRPAEKFKSLLTAKTTRMEKSKITPTKKAKLTSKTNRSEETKLAPKTQPMGKANLTVKTQPTEKTIKKLTLESKLTTKETKQKSKTQPKKKTRNFMPNLKPTQNKTAMETLSVKNVIVGLQNVPVSLFPADSAYDAHGVVCDFSGDYPFVPYRSPPSSSDSSTEMEPILSRPTPKTKPSEKANLTLKTKLMDKAKKSTLETKLTKETKQKSETPPREITLKLSPERKSTQKTAREMKPTQKMAMHDIKLKSESSSAIKEVDIVETVPDRSFPADRAYDNGGDTDVESDSSGDCSLVAKRLPVAFQSPSSPQESSKKPKTISSCANLASSRTATVVTVIESEADLSNVTDLSDWVTLDGQPMFKIDSTECLDDDTSPSEESRNGLLMHAVKMGDNATVQEILAVNDGCDVEQTNERGTTLLMKALLKFHDDVVETLLSKGANPNARHSKGTTPLIIAIRNNGPKNITQASSRENKNIRSIAALLKAGARVNVCDENGDSALVKACGRGNVDIVRILLLNGANFVPAVTVACKYSLEVRQCLERHVFTVRDEFQATVNVCLNRKAKIVAELFPIHCFCPSRNDTHLDTQLDVMFKQSELNVSNMQPGAGNLLFIAHSEFNSDSVRCRLSGPCIVLNVTLNGMRQLPLMKNCNFVYKLSSIRVGENKLKIFTVPSEKPSVKLVVCAYNAQLPSTAN